MLLTTIIILLPVMPKRTRELVMPCNLTSHAIGLGCIFCCSGGCFKSRRNGSCILGLCSILIIERNSIC